MTFINYENKPLKLGKSLGQSTQQLMPDSFQLNMPTSAGQHLPGAPNQFQNFLGYPANDSQQIFPGGFSQPDLAQAFTSMKNQNFAQQPPQFAQFGSSQQPFVQAQFAQQQTQQPQQFFSPQVQQMPQQQQAQQGQQFFSMPQSNQMYQIPTQSQSQAHQLFTLNSGQKPLVKSQMQQFLGTPQLIASPNASAQLAQLSQMTGNLPFLTQQNLPNNHNFLTSSQPLSMKNFSNGFF